MSVKELKTVCYKGNKYFVDNRLQEFRAVNCPYKSIPFNSFKGHKILEYMYNNVKGQ